MAETAKKHKVSEQTIYAWRKHFGGLEPADVKRLKALELENAKLKKLLAERDLDIDLLKDINRRKWLIRVPRSTLCYALRQPGKDGPVLETMRALSSQYPRYGYRRIRIFLRRQGLAMACRTCGWRIPNQAAIGVWNRARQCCRQT